MQPAVGERRDAELIWPTRRRGGKRNTGVAVLGAPLQASAPWCRALQPGLPRQAAVHHGQQAGVRQRRRHALLVRQLLVHRRLARVAARRQPDVGLRARWDAWRARWLAVAEACARWRQLASKVLEHSSQRVQCVCMLEHSSQRVHTLFRHPQPRTTTPAPSQQQAARGCPPTLKRGGSARSSLTRMQSPVSVAMLQCSTVGVNRTCSRQRARRVGATSRGVMARVLAFWQSPGRLSISRPLSRPTARRQNAPAPCPPCHPPLSPLRSLRSAAQACKDARGR